MKQLPPEFLHRMQAQLGDDFDAFVAALNEHAPTSIRLNPRKAPLRFVEEEKVSWCDQGRYLAQRPSFTFDPLFHAGTYYVQEASSMFLEQIFYSLKLEGAALRVLDLCAAPGGKSTHLLSLMNEESLLVSNELIPNRNRVLQQNISKWGNASCIVTQNEAQHFAQLENYFDIIVVDAPCSGEGLFRKDENAADEWSEKSAAMCATRQQNILRDVLPALKPGGFLIYSTCTYNPQENEEVVREICDFGLRTSDLKYSMSGVMQSNFGFHFLPHRTKGEGFFVTCLQKEVALTVRSTSNKQQAVSSEQLLLAQYFVDAQKFSVVNANGKLMAFPSSLMHDYTLLRSQLYLRQCGTLLGEWKGKDFIPAHELAMSVHLRSDLPRVDLLRELALKYLRCETFSVDSELRGWCLASFEGKNLGWMKLMPGRMNNYYPKELRIMKQLP